MGDSLIVLFDTPSIKQYVFGTDVLREIRGASANLDRLNRVETQKRLERALPDSAKVTKVYANGGSAQFVVEDADEDGVRRACDAIVSLFMEKTAGDVKPVYGVSSFSEANGYQDAVSNAFLELRARRECAVELRTPSLMPVMAECSSASHLPAAVIATIGGDRRALSESAQVKERRGRDAREHGIWADWMKHCAESGPWPGEEEWDDLRFDDMVRIGEQSSGRLIGDIGLVYADGNAMGRVVQQLNSPAVCREFSSIVDRSIRNSCFEALGDVCSEEIAAIREGNGAGELQRLPADILLLGGDDLLVILPADRALKFAESAAQRFRDLTHSAIDELSEPAVKRFFDQVNVMEFSISCGVAIARSSYPFYLLLDLAEDLLKNAKRGDGEGLHDGSGSPSRIDFHVVAGANSFSLSQTRTEDYACGSSCVRTLRPYDLELLDRLRQSAEMLRLARFPRSKLHALHEAALRTSPNQAQRAIRDIFGRCRHSGSRNERRALWLAIENLCPERWRFDSTTFPFYVKEDRALLSVADLVEAVEVL